MTDDELKKYSMLLATNQILLENNLITKNEYEKILEILKKKYGK